jgi:hypothetical protein
VVDVTATGKGPGPQSETCRELKTAGFPAIGPLGLMAGGPEHHFTDSHELYVLVEGDEWAHMEARDPDAGYWARRFAQLVNWQTRGEKSRDRAVVPSAAELVEQLKEIARLRAEGALTESEFEAVKARLLSDEASA